MCSWKLISLPEALKKANDAVATACRAVENIDLQGALGRIAAQDILCPEDNPAFDRSIVDGYALSSRNLHNASGKKPVEFKVAGEIRMGQSAGIAVSEGEALRIPTGGMMPMGADCVAMQENVSLTGSRTIRLSRPLFRGENVIKRGDDAAAGSIIVSAGHCIGAADLGILASCGIVEVPVVKKLRVFIVTTGDEIVEPTAKPGPGQVRDVNSYTLSALALEAGCEVVSVVRAPDRLDILTEIIFKAAAESDIVLVSGGSSVGDRDFTTPAVASLPEAKIVFHGIAIKPGKPSLMAMAGKTAVFGIPGHAVAAMTIFAEIVEPVIRKIMGASGCSSRFFVKACLCAALQPDKERDEIVRVILERRDGILTAVPLPPRSGLITSMSRAHGLIYTQKGQPMINEGAEVEVQLLKNNDGIWRGECK